MNENQVPIIKFRAEGPVVVTTLYIPLEKGNAMAFSARVDRNKIIEQLRKAQISGNTIPIAGLCADDEPWERPIAGDYWQPPPEIGNILGSIVKGLKKGVSTVAKATGVDKVLKIAKKAINNPLIKSIVPGAAAAATALSVTDKVLKLKVDATKGKPTAVKALAKVKAAADKPAKKATGLAAMAKKSTAKVTAVTKAAAPKPAAKPVMTAIKAPTLSLPKPAASSAKPVATLSTPTTSSVKPAATSAPVVQKVLQESLAAAAPAGRVITIMLP
jgi:hypothetical protein